MVNISYNKLLIVKGVAYMKKKLSIIFTLIILILALSSCSSKKINLSLADNSKLLTTVGNVNITQHRVDVRRKDSDFSDQARSFSDKEVIDKLIDEELLLIKAKEFKITMSDSEVVADYKLMLEQMNFKPYVKGDENKIDKATLEGLRNEFIRQKTVQKLNYIVDPVLNQLKQTVKIKYYD